MHEIAITVPLTASPIGSIYLVHCKKFQVDRKLQVEAKDLSLQTKTHAYIQHEIVAKFMEGAKL